MHVCKTVVFSKLQYFFFFLFSFLFFFLQAQFIEQPWKYADHKLLCKHVKGRKFFFWIFATSHWQNWNVSVTCGMDSPVKTLSIHFEWHRWISWLVMFIKLPSAPPSHLGLYPSYCTSIAWVFNGLQYGKKTMPESEVVHVCQIQWGSCSNILAETTKRCMFLCTGGMASFESPTLLELRSSSLFWLFSGSFISDKFCFLFLEMFRRYCFCFCHSVTNIQASNKTLNITQSHAIVMVWIIGKPDQSDHIITRPGIK